jgi:hypothetical protein
LAPLTHLTGLNRVSTDKTLNWQRSSPPDRSIYASEGVASLSSLSGIKGVDRVTPDRRLTLEKKLSNTVTHLANRHFHFNVQTQ